MNAFLVLGSILIMAAAILHVLIFIMESVLWVKPSVWRRFGLKTQQEAEVMRAMAYNQGYYNVFLALGAGSGLIMLGSTNLAQGGFVLALFSALSMVLAAIVLVTSNRKLVRAALVQGLPPLLGIIFLVLGVTT